MTKFKIKINIKSNIKTIKIVLFICNHNKIFNNKIKDNKIKYNKIKDTKIPVFKLIPAFTDKSNIKDRINKLTMQIKSHNSFIKQSRINQ